MATNFNTSPQAYFSPPQRAATTVRQQSAQQHCPPVPADRMAIVLGGAALAVCGLTRGTLPGLVAAALGGYAAYCAAGACNPELSEINRTFGGPHLDRPPVDDAVDETLLDSFPASDPPAFSSARG